ncbi:MAG: hypothetical protein HXY50_16670 [Ignavibacteriaceae bacterium]|nr:hypothetical protein [Ignavibacteriaceae bacterium]
MNSENFTSKFWVVTIMILTAAFTRLIPHPPNFTAVGAIALFGGAYFSDKKFAFIIPLLAMFLSDLAIGFHSGMISVYLSFVIIVGIGIMLSQNIKVKNIFAASLISSIIFFVLTNFQMWLQGTLYPKNISGLIACYVAAIPFFGNSVLGDLFFVGILFGLYALIQKKLPAAVKVRA